jgi:hypothetical protein
LRHIGEARTDMVCGVPFWPGVFSPSMTLRAGKSTVSRLSLFSNEGHLLSDVHMDASLHRRTLGAVALRPRRRPVVAVGAAAVPGAAGVGASDDLEQLARVDVTDLDKVPREEQEPRRVEGDRLGDRLPLDSLIAARRLAVLLDVKAEG